VSGPLVVKAAEGTYTPKWYPMIPATVNDPHTYSTTQREEAFVLRDHVQLWGSYPADGGDSRNPEARSTILSGDLAGNDDNTEIYQPYSDNAYHVVLGVNIPANSGTVLDGLTISGGYADGTMQLPLNGDIPQNAGGGIYLHSASPILTNGTISGNTAGNHGGGMYNYGSSPTLTNVIISGNTATTGNGGGIANLWSSAPALTNVIISGNTTAGNASTSRGGGMYNISSSPILTNITISGNRTPGSGGGMFNITSSAPKIRNSIIWGNTSGITNSISTPVIAYSIVQDAGYGTTPNADFNMTIDPLFVEWIDPSAGGWTPTTGGDYRLGTDSPAIDAGSNDYYDPGETPDLSAVTTDLDGTARIKGGVADLGAYEKE
jgi:hypothetical protein